jgi:hypothetical protein
MAEDLFFLVIVVLGPCALAFAVIGHILVKRDTARKGRWGINLSPMSCSKCSTPAPAVRLPASLRRALWGGWTCSQCGFELDKWGRPVENQPFPAKWSASIENIRSAVDSANKRYRASPEEFH